MAALGHLGMTEEARDPVGEFRDRILDYVERNPFPMWRENVADHFVSGFRKAGLID